MNTHGEHMEIESEREGEERKGQRKRMNLRKLREMDEYERIFKTRALRRIGSLGAHAKDLNSNIRWKYQKEMEGFNCRNVSVGH
jgi:hypothetical protein